MEREAEKGRNACKIPIVDQQASEIWDLGHKRDRNFRREERNVLVNS